MFYANLTRIRFNPWQTRQEVNSGYIRELAADIVARYPARPETRGLLQTPLGRLVDAQGKRVPGADAQAYLHLGDVTPNLEARDWHVQLAFGHNRLAAFVLLHDGGGDDPAWLIEHGLSLDDHARFACFPIEYADFSDEEMATAAWAENAQRRDLSAVEEALAIRRAQAGFGWSNSEIARRWGISPAAISNKLRLLNLPEDVQADIREGTISERQAMALAPGFELLDMPMLPRAARDEIKKHWRSPDKLAERARLGGVTSNDLRDYVDTLVTCVTQKLDDAVFPLDEFLTYADGAGAPCAQCRLVVKHKGVDRCPDSKCWKAKMAAWTEKQLAAASEATGLPIAPTDIPWSEKETFNSGEAIALGREILGREERCANLALWHAPHSDYGLRLPDFPDIRVLCHHPGESHCKCLTQAKSAATRQENARDPEIQARKEREKQVQAIADPAIAALDAALREMHPGAWGWLCRKVTYQKNVDGWTVDQIIAKTAASLVRALFFADVAPDIARQHIAREFESVGLPWPWAEGDPLDRIKVKLDRIEGWMRDISAAMPPTAALNGNMDNLTNLQIELADIAPSDEKSDIEKHLDGLLDVLYDLVVISARWQPEDAEEWTHHAAWLTSTPAGDINFISHLKQVTRPNVIEAAGALLMMQREIKGKAQALDRRLRLLEKPTEEVEE